MMARVMAVVVVHSITVLGCVVPNAAATRAARQLKGLEQRVAEAADQATRCEAGLACLAEMDEAEITFALGANAINRAMSLCCHDNACVERLRERLDAHHSPGPDATTYEILAASRHESSSKPPSEALSAIADMLHTIERTGQKKRALTKRALGLCERVFEACTNSGVEVAQYEADIERLRSIGLAPKYERLRVERTLAMLKPGVSDNDESVAAIKGLVTDAGFAILSERRVYFDRDEAARFLRTSWGTSAGDESRRFFREMVEFYASGPVHALLLEREDAIRRWRTLLGPGDPSVARVKAADSVRSLFGTNKMANGAHGADSFAAAQREIRLLFEQRLGSEEPL